MRSFSHFHSLSIRLFALLLPTFAFSQQAAVASRAPAGVSAGEVAISKQKSSTLGKDLYQRVRGTTGGASAQAKDWGVFDLVFLLKTAPRWVDEAVVTYSVMLQQTAAKTAQTPDGKLLSLLRTTLSYKDLEGDPRIEHKVGVVVAPSTFERYGKPIGFAAQLSIAGKEVASYGVGEGLLQGKDKWWTVSQIVDSPNVAKRTGLLLDRSQTPFALMDIDSYEMSARP